MRATRSPNGLARTEADRPLDRQMETLLEALYRRATAHGEELTLKAWLELVEAWRISSALEATRGNRKEAARALGIARRTLYHRMKQLALAPPRIAGEPSAPSGCARTQQTSKLKP